MRKISAVVAVFAIFSGVGAPVSWAKDAARGKDLHDASCITDCHAAKVQGASNALYTRKNSLKTLEKLKSQVSFCNQQVLDSEWWPEDEADVVSYLNNAFYHFK